MADDGVVKGGVTAEVLEGINDGLNFVLRPILTSLPMFIIGWLMLLQWHAFPFLNLRRGKVARAFGQGAVVLQFYCDPELKSAYPFVISCFVVLVDQIFLQYGLAWYLRNNENCSCGTFCGTFSSDNSAKVLKAENSLEEDEDSLKVVKNKYMDPSVESRKIILLFIGQLGLMMYFIYTLNSDDASHEIDNVNFVKWSLALILTLCVDDDEAGVAYVKSYWVPDSSLLDNPADVGKYCLMENQKAKELKTKRRIIFGFGTKYSTFSLTHEQEWKVRRFCDATVNGICRAVIMATAPMLLCTEEPIDFIKDCLALFFISKLDDLDDCRTLDFALDEAKKIYDRDAQAMGWDEMDEPETGEPLRKGLLPVRR